MSTKTSFDFITSVNNQQKIEIDKNYNQFLLVRGFSYFVDTILYSSEANSFTNVPNNLHYEYFFNSISKKKRYSKWFKSEKKEQLDMVAQYYNFSYAKANEALKVLSPENLEYISEWYKEKGE
jgi:hypothetical protein